MWCIFLFQRGLISLCDFWLVCLLCKTSSFIHLNSVFIHVNQLLLICEHCTLYFIIFSQRYLFCIKWYMCVNKLFFMFRLCRSHIANVVSESSDCAKLCKLLHVRQKISQSSLSKTGHFYLRYNSLYLNSCDSSLLSFLTLSTR